MPWMVPAAIVGTGLLSYMGNRESVAAMKDQAGFQNMLALKYLEASEEERKRFRELYGPVEKHLSGMALRMLKGDFSSGPFARSMEAINPAFERNELAIKRNFAATGRPDSGYQHKLLAKNQLARTGAHIRARRDAEMEGPKFAMNFLRTGKGIPGQANQLMGMASGAGYRGGSLMNTAMQNELAGRDRMLGMGLDALRLWSGGGSGGGGAVSYADKQARIDAVTRDDFNPY